MIELSPHMQALLPLYILSGVLKLQALPLSLGLHRQAHLRARLRKRDSNE